jgi:biotin operon repressor
VSFAASKNDPIMQLMANPKLDKAMRLLVAIERQPQSSHVLAGTLQTSRPTVIRLVEDLRELGCNIEAMREGKSDWAYHLHDWGVFEPARVRAYLKDQLP